MRKNSSRALAYSRFCSSSIPGCSEASPPTAAGEASWLRPGTDDIKQKPTSTISDLRHAVIAAPFYTVPVGSMKWIASAHSIPLRTIPTTNEFLDKFPTFPIIGECHAIQKRRLWRQGLVYWTFNVISRTSTQFKLASLWVQGMSRQQATPFQILQVSMSNRKGAVLSQTETDANPFEGECCAALCCITGCPRTWRPLTSAYGGRRGAYRRTVKRG